jgi:biotin transporter BioY
MYIIAIAWLYVTVLMAATEKSVVAGLLTFIFYGLIPCAILLWILGKKHRRFKAMNQQSLDQNMHEPNREDPKSDQ